VQVVEPATPHATHLRCPFAGDGRPARPQLQHGATGRARGLLATAVPLTLRPASGFPQSFQTGADHVIVSVVQFEQHMRADRFCVPELQCMGSEMGGRMAVMGQARVREGGRRCEDVA